ncbi:hypothetical protein SEA_ANGRYORCHARD_2 [Rhodococcus phage AngryOrchard]|uniref:Uncharacterized protein n=1 Tax=Rhodococcus phage AngryOrchard TaxID=1955425 RepID=A0A1S5VY30_9CAUD|nr:hypothetical protein SEA_ANGRYORCHARD_2 [Rhodococcus phage AngryOrchard]
MDLIRSQVPSTTRLEHHPPNDPHEGSSEMPAPVARLHHRRNRG